MSKRFSEEQIFELWATVDGCCLRSHKHLTAAIKPLLCRVPLINTSGIPRGVFCDSVMKKDSGCGMNQDKKKLIRGTIAEEKKH